MNTLQTKAGIRQPVSTGANYQGCVQDYDPLAGVKTTVKSRVTTDMRWKSLKEKCRFLMVMEAM